MDRMRSLGLSETFVVAKLFLKLTTKQIIEKHEGEYRRRPVMPSDLDVGSVTLAYKPVSKSYYPDATEETLLSSVGVSKFGGLPHLPVDGSVKWPARVHSALTQFIGQIRLSDFRYAHTHNSLTRQH